MDEWVRSMLSTTANRDSPKRPTKREFLHQRTSAPSPVERMAVEMQSLGHRDAKRSYDTLGVVQRRVHISSVPVSVELTK
jgi:hypothetical protein